MKRLLIVLLFFLFLFPSLSREGSGVGFVYAQSTTITENQTTTTTTPPEESLLTKFWSWISKVFIKTDYTIAQRPSDEINSDMTDYDTASDNRKHSSSGTRLTDSSSQTCYKGNVIKKVILGEYQDSDISHICPDPSDSNKCIVSSDSTCKLIKISDLAHYFVQTQKQFYCAGNKLTNTESNVIDKVNEKYSNSISSNDLDCYQTIYNDFYLVPKESVENEENSKNIVQTPISAGDQKSGSISDTKDQLNKNFVPANQSWDGLSSLRPQSWGKGSSGISWGTSGEFNGGGTSSGTCNAIDSHCRGMSLYGALGLSQSGKNYEEILNFFYGSISLKTINTSNTNISVKTDSNDDCSSYQPLNLETYLSGLGEMSDYWGDPSTNGYESMKALVVAARTYAYVATQNFTQPICSNSNCQNFHCSVIKTKPNLDRAIKETQGQIIVDSTNQTPFLTEYARSFCGPSKTVVFSNHTNTSVNGYEYELKALSGDSPFCLN
ncbi:MAG: SpoIID/LytB domain-containing protein [Candidatus Shapirobacteria bacterium]|nr:SpoIID/LytB domain-containing protein [Candidatus Shapirobacteria bacterium]